MGLNDFVGHWRKGTFNVLKVNNKATIGDQAIIANQGTSYFVDSGSGSSTNDGKSWSTALDTLDNAINKCTANQGDIIYIAEGHEESYTTTGAKAIFDIDGITIIGLGQGSDRPSFSFGHTGATWTISGDNVIISNLLLLTAVDSVVTYGTISGADCKLVDVETRDVANKEVIDAWTCTTGASRLEVLNYRHIGDIATGNANQSIFNLTDVSDFIIKKSIFMTKANTGIIEIASTATNAVIDDCVFYVDGTSDLSLNIVDTDDDSTVVVRNCFDLEEMYKFSGGNNGSGFSVASDDVSAVSTAVNNSNSNLNYSHPRYLTITADLSSETWNTVATHELFTVTGLVRMKVLAEVTVSGEDTSGDTATIQLGVEDSTNDWIAATQVDDLTAGVIWADATPTETNGNFTSLVFDKVVNGKDVGYEISVEAATAGTIVFHCWYEALKTGSSVVVSDGSAMV